MDEFILEARNLTTIVGRRAGFLRARRKPTRAVDDVSIAVRSGETFGIVGESGCGKTTLGRTLLGVIREASGEIHLDGRRVDGLEPRQARRARSAIQYLHQDAVGSLDPWWSVGRSIAEASIILGVGRANAFDIDRRLADVGLDPTIKRRYPHQLSGGQLRRVALARLLAFSPRVIILDEPTAGLDLSIQATILNLLSTARRTFGLTNILISHDMAVIRLMCDRVAVMYRGRIVEQAPSAELFQRPLHPYTRALLAATPRLSRHREAPAIKGEPPSMIEEISGCSFRTRCPHAEPACAQVRPQLESAGKDAYVACHRWRELDKTHADGISTSGRGG